MYLSLSIYIYIYISIRTLRKMQVRIALRGLRLNLFGSFRFKEATVCIVLYRDLVFEHRFFVRNH